MVGLVDRINLTRPKKFFEQEGWINPITLWKVMYDYPTKCVRCYNEAGRNVAMFEDGADGIGR